jgi:hypothetical protein
MSYVRPNGRVDVLSQAPPNPLSLQDKIQLQECTTYQEAMTGNWTDTPLSKVFFSKENMQIVQNGIRAGVNKMSNGQYVIGQQSCDELKIVMRAQYLEHSANLPYNIPQQIAALNNYVFGYCVPRVYSEAQGYLKYLHDASTLVVPLATPVYARPDNKTLELKPFF